MMFRGEALDDRELIGKIDRAGMLEVLARMPEMFEEAAKFSLGLEIPLAQESNLIIVAGLGGSAISGDLAADIFSKEIKIPLITCRSYALPKYAGPKTTIFALSYSGETEEVLAAVKEGEKIGAKIICITSGGKLRTIAERQRYPLVLLPTGYQPRAALPYLLVPLLTGISQLGAANWRKEESKETAALLKTLRDEYGPAKAARVNPVKQLAKKINGRLPIIFGATGTTGATALRFKTQFNENSKVTALANQFSELNHNEIVNLCALKRETHNFSLIILRDGEDSEQIKKRIEITKSLLSRQVGGINEICSRGEAKLTRIMSLICFGDYLSVYLALLQGIDPTEVEAISKFKKEMSR